MARYIILLLAAIAVVQGTPLAGWGSPPATPGWTTTTPPPDPTTTPGWSIPDPTTTTPGWSIPDPTTTTPGWTSAPPPPPPSGWGPSPSNNVTIALTGELAAAGAGWAAENHAENIQVTGGWGVPAELLVSAGGESVVSQEGSIIQVTNVDSESASSLNAVHVDQIAEADESLAVIASSLNVLVGQQGSAAATGLGASSAAADTILLVNH